MDNSETLVIVAALFAALALGGPRAEAIQKHADSRYLRLQAASPPPPTDCVAAMTGSLRMQECLAGQAGR